MTAVVYMIICTCINIKLYGMENKEDYYDDLFIFMPGITLSSIIIYIFMKIWEIIFDWLMPKIFSTLSKAISINRKRAKRKM